MAIGRSVGGKLLLVAGSAIGVLLALALFVFAGNAGNAVADLTDKYSRSASETVAKGLSEEIRRIEATAVSMAFAIGAVEGHGVDTQRLILDILKPNATATQYILGSWFFPVGPSNVADPAMIGQKEAGFTKTGYFYPYWVRSGDQLSQEPVDDMPLLEQPLYTVPLKEKRPALSEPYPYEVNGKTVLMVSLSTPVLRDGQVTSVVGFDIALGDLATALAKLRPFGDGRVMLLSETGKWVSHPDSALLMKDYADAEAGLVRKAIADKAPVSFERTDADGRVWNRSVTPLVFDAMGATTWALVTDVPAATLAAPVRSLSTTLAIGSVLIIAVVLGSLYLAIRTLVRKPLDRLLASVTRLGNGDYDKAMDGTARRDEFGTISTALETFRQALSDGRRMRVEQEEMRASSQAARDRQSAIDNAKAEDLRAFVHQVEASFERLSGSDLTVRMTEVVAPEFEPIRVYFNNSVSQLESTIGQVVGSVGAMRAGLRDITAATGDLSQRTEQQAASLEETVAALSEVTRGVTGTAKSADAVRQAASLACREAENGGEVVAKAVTAMAGIEESSQRIGNIIGVIDEIAFQTNLLALNAGVEAARAGEAGRGFAVVAQEVRGLAQRSAQSAKEIKDLIATSSAQVGEGVQLVAASGRSLQTIVGQVGDVAQAIAVMADAARDQATSLKEVSAAADQMDKVTQQNAAMVE